jgi:hypothetical protein
MASSLTRVLAVSAILLAAALLLPFARVIATPPYGPLYDAVDERDEVLELRFRWLYEAREEAPVRAWLEQRLSALREAARETASQDEEASRAGLRPFRPHRVEEDWDYAGDSERLFSLIGTTVRFTNAAPPAVEYRTLLWDRIAGRPITVAELFTSADALGAFEARFCAELRRQRSEHLGRPAPDRCPAMESAVMTPRATDMEGTFDALGFHLPSGAAADWPEGAYRVDVALTPADLRRIRSEYRGEFRAAQPH